MARRIRRRYKKFDVKLVCKIERPDDYGIRLLPGAERAAGMPKRDRHKRSRIAYCRLEEEAWAKLQLYLQREKKTMQALIEGYLLELISDIEAIQEGS